MIFSSIKQNLPDWQAIMGVCAGLTTNAADNCSVLLSQAVLKHRAQHYLSRAEAKERRSRSLDFAAYDLRIRASMLLRKLKQKDVLDRLIKRAGDIPDEAVF